MLCPISLKPVRSKARASETHTPQSFNNSWVDAFIFDGGQRTIVSFSRPFRPVTKRAMKKLPGLLFLVKSGFARLENLWDALGVVGFVYLFSL